MSGVKDPIRDPEIREMLIEENRLLREAIEHTPYPHAVFDQMGRLIAHSRAFSLTHPDLKEALSETKEGDQVSYEWLLRRALRGQMPEEELDVAVAQRVSQGIPSDQYYPELGWLRIIRYGMPCGTTAGIAVDITEIKDKEQELHRAREMAEESERQRSEFLANMSHEIRTPMNGVLGMANLLQHTQLDEKQQMLVDTIARSGKDLVRIIDDVLDIARIEAVGLELNSNPFDPSEAVEDVAALLAGKAAEKGLELCITFSGCMPKQVIGDAARFRQVLINLIGNAIKFTESGHVLVRVLPLAPEIKQINRTVDLKVEIEDTGIGISDEVRGSIFQKFARAGELTEQRSTGTGLGLSITKAIIDQMGGEIGVDSDSDSGSTFWFRIELPIIGPKSVVKPKKVSQFTTVRVLIVGDAAVNQTILAEQMMAWGCEPITLISAADALQILKNVGADSSGIDLVIIDGDLPEMPGDELLRQIRIQTGNTCLPVIMLSSVQQPDLTERLSHLGLYAVLIKPPRSNHLREAVLSAVMKRHEDMYRQNLENAPRVQDHY